MLNYIGQSGQNVFDLALVTVGDINQMYAMLQSNGLNITSDPTGQAVQYTPAPTIPPTTQASAVYSPPTTATFNSVTNQNIFDVVLQTYGDLNLTYTLMQENNFLYINQTVLPNNLFIFNPSQIKDTLLVRHLRSNGLIVNTSVSQVGIKVFSTEDETLIFSTEDGSKDFTYES